MKVIIDRIENNVAVVELPDKKMVSVSADIFENASEGDVYEISKADSTNLKTETEKLMESVWED